MDAHEFIHTECRLRGVGFELIPSNKMLAIYTEIEQGNMDIVLLEKSPKIAIYTPPNKQPWDDAVTLALAYAEVDYETLWDEEVHLGKLDNYDWLHLHHEDFTGQYGKFYATFKNASKYISTRLFLARASCLSSKSVIKVTSTTGRNSP